MNQSTAEAKLILSAARIARSNPELWRQFIADFQQLSAVHTINLVQSPLDTLQTAQGRAQLAAHLNDLLTNCVASADKIESKQK
jgi:hypothetical protein